MEVKVIKVIEVVEEKPDPITINDLTFAVRKVIRYYDLNGKFLAERDATAEKIREVAPI